MFDSTGVMGPRVTIVIASGARRAIAESSVGNDESFDELCLR